MIKAQQVVLAKRPQGPMNPSDFALKSVELPPLKQNQFLIKNKILSLDAGFRQWMNAGASDNYLTEMPLGSAVQSIILGDVVESNNPNYPAGTCVVGRTAWESHSIADGSDLMTKIDTSADVPPEHYLSALGPSGMTAYFGLRRIGQPKAGDVLLVSAAAGGVGSLVGQLGKVFGCTTIGISSSTEKCDWLTTQMGYDHVINYRQQPSLSEQIQAIAPEGVDIYFDNVGGSMLDTVMSHLALNARIVLCGAISQYETDDTPGIKNMWELITKRARAEGFMFSDYVDEYEQASAELATWIAEGKLTSPINRSHGIESTGQAFCDMLAGKNMGKSLVLLDA